MCSSAPLILMWPPSEPPNQERIIILLVFTRALWASHGKKDPKLALTDDTYNSNKSECLSRSVQLMDCLLPWISENPSFPLLTHFFSLSKKLPLHQIRWNLAVTCKQPWSPSVQHQKPSVRNWHLFSHLNNFPFFFSPLFPLRLHKSVFTGSLGCGNLRERRASGLVFCESNTSEYRTICVSHPVPLHPNSVSIRCVHWCEWNGNRSPWNLCRQACASCILP